jgi:hypothetical protein
LSLFHHFHKFASEPYALLLSFIRHFSPSLILQKGDISTERRQIFAPLIRQQMPFTASQPAFAVIPAVGEKLTGISPAAPALMGKSLTKSGKFLKHLIPIRTFYTSEKPPPGVSKLTPADFSLTPLRSVYSGQYILIRRRCRLRLAIPVFPPQ